MCSSDLHQKLQDYVKDLNAFYKKHKCLWELDPVFEGFEWIDCDNKDESIIAFMRKGKKPNQFLVIVVNFTPNVRYNYRIGVPVKGTYEEVFASDSPKYYGSGVLNGKVMSQDGYAHNKEQFIELNIPPLGISIFELVK